jgi:hypothetical protein
MHSRPQAILCALAMVATLLACAPLLFLGKSLLSPGNHGVDLFYERCPALPGYADCSIEQVHGADVGAMAWAFFPLSVAQERSIRAFGEFPLWNRYNSAGTSMIGQGQMMLGDPIQWLSWLVGVDALIFDLKFVLLRAVFAAALGVSVFVVTRALVPSALVAFASPFIGYFIYRVNHPAIFTLCYSALILLAWLKLIYGEERRRLAWVAGLMLANWLVLNSGTAKEAYMAILTLNALGAALFVVERSRLGPRFRQYSLLVAAAGICFLMMASPVWGSLFDAIRGGTSNYALPAAHQLRPQLFLGFVDNFYFLLSAGTYFPAINPLLFTGFAAGLLCALRKASAQLRRPALVLSAGCLALLAVAYGVLPGQWLLHVPFVRNIIHIHNTFSTIVLVPACILAGIGFAHLGAQADSRERRKLLLVVALMLAGLLLAYLPVLDALLASLFAVDAVPYTIAVLGSAVLLPALLFRMARGRMSYAGVLACLIMFALVLGRGAMYPGDVFDNLVLNPKHRVNLTVRPQILNRLALAMRAEPSRALGLGGVLFPGYNATLGLESINGPDAIWNRRYRELTESLGMPFLKSWGWRMEFHESHLATHAKQLDLLGVGVVLTSRRLSAGAGLEYVVEDARVAAYSRTHAWPRAFYTDRLVAYDNVQALAERVAHGDGKPFVALEQGSAQANPLMSRLLGAAPAAGAGVMVKARDYALTNNTTSFTIDAPAAGVVYLGETDEPGGFSVTINGAAATYLTANHAFKAVLVDRPGTYRITFRYWPARLSVYLTVAGLGLALWVATVLAFLRRGRQSHPGPLTRT